MSVAVPPLPSSMAGSPSQQMATASSTPASPYMSSPSTHAHESTLLTTFDSTTNMTDTHPHKSDLDAEQDEVAPLRSASHPSSSFPPATSASIHKGASAVSSVASTSFSNTDHVSVPLPADTSARDIEHGVSPVINAFRSPYPHSPSYFVTVVPPDDFPIAPGTSQHERDRTQRGSLLPLYPTLGGQLWAISREFALPSLGGLMLYLSDDGQGNRGPRIGDAAWQALWARYFNEDDAPSTSTCKSQPAFTPSRRSSVVAADSLADASAVSGAHTADVSRSTLGEASSSRPNIPYLSSSRPSPSPRVEALSFPRRDTSADWSPSTRSVGWFANVSSSAGRAQPPSLPFPQLPILARIEWQVDSVKAPWWPSWVLSRSAAREQRPLHKTRKSLHLANHLSQTKQAALGVHDDDDDVDNEVDQRKGTEEDQQEDDDKSQILYTPDPASTQKQPPLIEHAQTAGAGPSATRSASLSQNGLRESRAFTDAFAPTAPLISEDNQQDTTRSLAPSTSARSLPDTQDVLKAPVEQSVANDNVVVGSEPIIEHDAELRPRSPSDEPLKSDRASIVSMSSAGSPRMPAIPHASGPTRPTAAQVIVPSAPSVASQGESDSASARSHLDINDAMNSHRDASDQSRTGYTEILDVNDADEQGTDNEGDSSHEPLSLARDGDYAALPDSPVSPVHQLPHLPSASDREQQRFSQQGFPPRHSFIVDAGDEAMWRDLHHHGMDPMTPEPREDSRIFATEHHQHPEAEVQAQQAPTVESPTRFGLVRKSDHDDEAQRQIDHALHQWAPHSVANDHQDLYRHQQQHFVQVDDFAHDAYYSPKRSNMARIQSWIGKTPTGRPNSSGAFDEYDFDRQADDQGLQLPAESEFDEVVGLWASKVRQDPYDIPHINGPTASVSGEDEVKGDGVKAEALNEEEQERQDQATEQCTGELDSLAATKAPALSLLSPIHLDAAAFDGVKPQLGNLAVPAPPQLLSPTAVQDAFNTPRAPADQRSVSTPILQQHPPSSPASLAPPLDRKNSSTSRRSSGDLSDTLQEMEKALELLSPSCSPNPALGHSPDPNGRKMSSRDSLAYARSLSASVTPSPKWIARSKAATAKARSHARRTFAVGGSPFDIGQVSPRPASTSAVSSSRARSPGFRAPLSASRLIEFAQAEAIGRQARTEVGDVEYTRSVDTIGDHDTQAAPSIVPVDSVDTQMSKDQPSSIPSTESVAEEKVQAPSAIEHEELHEDTGAMGKSTVGNIASDEPVETISSPVASLDQAVEPSVPTAREAGAAEADETQGMSAFMTDDHDVGIASIRQFLRDKVVSGVDSDASVLHDRTISGSDQQQDSSASGEGTIIERSASLDSDLRSATASEQQTSQAENAAVVEPQQANSPKEVLESEPRWSQASYASDHLSPRRLSGSAYSANSNSPRRDMHHEVRTPSFTYDAHLSSEPTTLDSQLSKSSTDGQGASVAGEVVKSYLTSSPSDEAFFISAGPTGAHVQQTEQPQRQQQQTQTQTASTVIESAEEAEGSVGGARQLPSREGLDSSEINGHDVASAADTVDQARTNASVPILAYKFASSPVHPETLPINGPLAGTHDDSLDEDEIRTMHEDTRAAVREALSQSTAHHVNIVPAVAPNAVVGAFSPKSTVSPLSSPLSSHSSLGEHFRRRGSTSSLNLTSTGGGSTSNMSSPNLNGAATPATRRRPSKLNLDIDGLSRSPPSTAVPASARRLPSTSPRARFGQLPPSPSLHPSYKAAMSSPLSQSSPQMGLGSPRGKTFLPSLTSVTSLEGELA